MGARGVAYHEVVAAVTKTRGRADVVNGVAGRGFAHRRQGFGAVGGSLLIIFVGMLVPVLAAAPFYILDHRARRREELKREQDQP
ncbi:hypothetical protein GCM10010470_65180 [Saccharopolyspora taberi]|uniref:Uncharacterized protein n=1 Tax=Saccharopolyspora taberi TaxID=60895 RepID=A0ABN3VNJ7_9PSEU